MKTALTINEIKRIKSALVALDGLQKVAELNNGIVASTQSFKISGPTRLLVAKNLRNLNPEIESHQNAFTALVRGISDGGSEVAPDQIKEFNRLNDALQAAPTSVELFAIGANEDAVKRELDLDRNAIPSDAVAIILQYLVEPEAK